MGKILERFREDCVMFYQVPRSHRNYLARQEVLVQLIQRWGGRRVKPHMGQIKRVLDRVESNVK